MRGKQAIILAAPEETLESRYQARLARFRRWEELEERLRGLAPKALDVLERALDNPADPKQAMTAALAVLRAAGLDGLKPPPPPSRSLMRLEDADQES